MFGQSLVSFLAANPDAAVSSASGAIASGAVAAGQLPPGMPPWAQWAMALAVSVAPLLLTRGIAAWAAGREALAVQKERRGSLLQGDADPTNDKEASILLDDAARLRAQAAAARAFGGGSKDKGPQ